ncbi:DUF4843 domain-containing protein [Solitalea koreensis]|uniref:DUF4843 domain-containing protein n=1 Tax=Solitalea koreensis TaxID=543615 RepID=A0A521AV72_9SPHI|nr:DUF4843 domain-containing protein [Solitalea koreensis]SMO38752.1 protein of unknown function [Solitalea koreensis]
MKKVKYFLGALALLALASCKEDEYLTYNEVARIQFGSIKSPRTSLSDTLKPYTFYYESPDLKQDTVFFDIFAMGGSTPKDRSFKLEQVQVDGANNAVPGKHFIRFDDPAVSKNYVIKAGTASSLVPVVLLRDASLKTSNVILKFNVVENEDFKLGEKAAVWRKIDFTDRLSEPAAWASLKGSYLGDYSVEKQKFMIQVTGIKWDQSYISQATTDISLLQYYLGTIKAALATYNAHNPRLKDEMDNYVVFP